MAVIPNDLSPIFEPSFVDAFADQLRRAAARLSTRTFNRPPALPTLLAAFWLHMRRRDERRLKEADTSYRPPAFFAPPPDAPSRRELLHFLGGAQAVYATSETAMTARLRKAGFSAPLQDRITSATNTSPFPSSSLSSSSPSSASVSGPTLHRVASAKFRPAFALTVDEIRAALVLIIRGSQEAADYVTDSAGDSIEFLDGHHAHEGIACSAHGLHADLRARMAAALDARPYLRRVIVTGHSLGAGCAAALTLLLRRQPGTGRTTTRGGVSARESGRATRLFAGTTCYAFAPPPVFDEALAEIAYGMRGAGPGGAAITTVVSGFDLVPRLSVRAIDELLVTLSRVDLSDAVQTGACGYVERALAPVLGQRAGRGVAVVVGTLAATLGTETLRGVAKAQAQTYVGQALTAAAELVVGELDSGAARARSAIVARTGNAVGGMGRAAGPGAEEPRRLRLPGTVWHAERAFRSPLGASDATVTAKARLVRRDAAYFDSLVVSAWMVHDHHPPHLRDVLSTLSPR